MVEPSSTIFVISCCLTSFSASRTTSAVSYRSRLFSYSSRRATTGSRPARSGLVSTRRSLRATASGDALRYMIRPVERKSSTELFCVIQPPPGDNTIPPPVLSSCVRADSIARKYSSPFSRKISRTSIPVLRSISRSKSRNGLSSRRAAAFPIVVLPTPGSPTRIRCGGGLSSLSVTQGLNVIVVVAPSFLERVSAELLEECLGDDECCHRFGDYSHRRNGRDITSFRHRLSGLPSLHFDRPERSHQRAYRLHRRAEHDLFTIGHAAFHSTGAIASPAHAPGSNVSLVGLDLVVNIGPLSSRRFNTPPALH